jgi:hypothetical protein
VRPGERVNRADTRRRYATVHATAEVSAREPEAAVGLPRCASSWTRVDAALLACLCAAVAFCSLRLREGYCDDALIVLRYAHNLLDGHGWTYNFDTAVNATTSPLHVLVVTALGACLAGDLLLALPLAFLLPLMAAVVVAYGALRPHGRVPAAMAGLLLAVAPRIYSTMGMESTLFVACALGACAMAARQRHLGAGLLAGAAVLARPDAGLLAGMLALVALRCGWRHALRFTAAATAVVLPWIVFATMKFGSPVPNTMAIKLAQRRLFEDPPIFLNGAWRELAKVDERAIGVGPHAVLALFVIAGAVLAWRARQHVAIALFTTFAALQFAAYAWLDLPPYHWYYAPALCAGALAIAVLFATAWQTQRPLPMLAGLLVATTFVATTMPDLIAPETSRQHYRDAAAWLAQNTPIDASIATGDIGIVGFHTLPRTIIDIQGLATPDAADAIARGDTGWWFDRYRPGYVLVHDPPCADFEAPVLERADFRAAYRLVEGTRLKGLAIWARIGTR